MASLTHDEIITSDYVYYKGNNIFIFWLNVILGCHKDILTISCQRTIYYLETVDTLLLKIVKYFENKYLVKHKAMLADLLYIPA